MRTFNSIAYGSIWHPSHGTASDIGSYLVSPLIPNTDAPDLDPFGVDGAGDLTIGAFSAPDGVNTNVLHGKPDVSGELTTNGSFSQTYGYFQMTGALPATPGIESAFWMLPQNGSWPPELDVMEISSNDPTTLVMTPHGDNAASEGWATVPDTQGFHTYGVNWTPTTLTWYFDGVQMYQTPTPDNMNTPMYLLLDTMTSTNGSMIGALPPTQFSDSLKVQSVQAFDSNPNINPTSTVTADEISANANGGMQFVYDIGYHYSEIDGFNPDQDTIVFDNSSGSFASLFISQGADGHAVIEDPSTHNIINIFGASPADLNNTNVLFPHS